MYAVVLVQLATVYISQVSTQNYDLMSNGKASLAIKVKQMFSYPLYRSAGVHASNFCRIITI